jgi:hypothetical protein
MHEASEKRRFVQHPVLRLPYIGSYTDRLTDWLAGWLAD